MSTPTGRDVVIVEAVRSPIGKRGGGLSHLHAVDLLAQVQRELIERSGIDPGEVEQVVGGCVSQVGMQAFNVARNAWIVAGLPVGASATTVDSQCGSSQQAANFATSMVASGVIDVAVACGVEAMSQVPMGASLGRGLGVGKAIPASYFERFEFTSQFEGAERIAEKYGITRQDVDDLGLLSQQRAAAAWNEDRYGTQIVPINVPEVDDEGNPTGTINQITRDEGLRETTLEGLAKLKPVAREDGVHTAGTASQISDGAGAVLIMTADKAAELGLTPRARIVDTCLVGCDPVLMLEGPIPATQRLLDRQGMSMSDIDVVEINEAFASVVISWEREMGADMTTVNPNGGAIAIGHPLGGTGSILITKTLHELERTDQEFGLITMCCGGGLGTGTLIQRV